MIIRNVSGIHTDVNGIDMGLLRQSALVKVLFNPTDAAIVKSWRSQANPNTYWLCRTPFDQDATIHEGALQAKYRAATTRDSVWAVGAWYADWIASWAIPAGLDYMFFEGGPNEMNDTTEKAVWYSESFTRKMLAYRLKPAPGMYSFGHPQTMKYDHVDGWAMWKPVFDVIDAANYGKTEPVAGFQTHEYAMNADMIGSIDYAIARYQLMPYKGPIFLGEFGYADAVKPPSTEQVLAQMTAINARLGADDRLCGFALYDIRKNAGGYDWSYMYGDLTRALQAQGLPTLPITIHTGSIIEVPPPDPPAPPDPPTIGENILVNPSFEGGAHKISANIVVPDGWAVGGALSVHSEIENHPPHVIDGVAAGRLWLSYEVDEMLFFQEVSVEPGAEYELIAYAFAWSTNDPQVGSLSEADIRVRVGLASGYVEAWSTIIKPRDEYRKLSVKIVAGSDKMTVKLLAVPEFGMARNDVFWDNISLTKVGNAPVVPATAKSTTANLYLRSGPGATYKKITLMPAGTTVTVKSVFGGWAHVTVSLDSWIVPLAVPDSEYQSWLKKNVSLDGFCSTAYLK